MQALGLRSKDVVENHVVPFHPNSPHDNGPEKHPSFATLVNWQGMQ
jgi:hypothetical protein